MKQHPQSRLAKMSRRQANHHLLANDQLNLVKAIAIVIISASLIAQNVHTASTDQILSQPQSSSSWSAPSQPQTPKQLASRLQEISANQMSPQQEQSFFSLKSFFTGQQRSPFSDRKCLMCRFSVSLINYALKTRRGYDQIDRIANTFCTAAHLESPLVCSQVSKLFNHEITKVLTYGVMTPNQVCGLLSNNTCGHFHSPLDDWEINLEASHQLSQSELTRMRADNRKVREAQKPSAWAPYRVIHISDTHIDTKYKPGAPVNCQEPLCCQSTSTPLNTTGATSPSDGTSEQVKAGHWGSYGQCDIPMWTFESTLKFIAGVIKEAKDIDYIIWTGDIQPHDVWAQNKKSAIQLYDAVFSRIFKHLPSVKILPTLGNHEMIPVDSFSPSNLLDIARDDSPVWLYKKLDSFWSRWLPKDTINTITKDGFYATLIRPGLKAISLNTNFCHSKNFWLFINSTDPGNQLQWLVHELQMSELIDEKVHIIGHIPPGSEDCMKVWSKNYNRILRRYARTITGQFFGHTHYNEFEMFYDEDKPIVAGGDKKKDNTLPRSSPTEPPQVVTSLAMLNTSSMTNVTTSLSDSVLAAASTSAKNITLKPIGVGFIGPSVTTFVNLNPSFRIYNIDPRRDFMPIDFETYFMNLTMANTNTTQDPDWTSGGMFSKIFNLNDTSPESMHELLTDIASDFRDDDEAAADEEESVDTSDEIASTSETSSTTTTNSTAPSTTPDSAKNEVEIETEDEDEEGDSDDRLYELYWMYNSYSDAFNRSIYDQIPLEDKRKFLCRLFTGQSHDALACDEFLPMVTLFKVASDLIQV